MTKYLKSLTIIYVSLVAPLITGIFFLKDPIVNLILNIALYIIVAFHVSIIFTLHKLFNNKKEFNEVFLHDLGYVGFLSPYADMSGAVFIHRDFGLFDPLYDEPFPDRKKAFRSYGYFIRFKKLHSVASFINYEGKIGAMEVEQLRNKLLQVLVWKTIKIAKELEVKYNLDTTINPIPLAAYLFRTSSVHNNPESREPQNKALLLWQNNRSLTLAFELRDYATEVIEGVIDLPDRWIKDVAELYSL
jgi:hypothetical protein